MNEIIKQFFIYESTLQKAKDIEKDLSWINRYSARIEELNQIRVNIENKDLKTLNEIVETESRAYGWSFYPGEHGKVAEEAFWNLKKLLLNNNLISNRT